MTSFSAVFSTYKLDREADELGVLLDEVLEAALLEVLELSSFR